VTSLLSRPILNEWFFVCLQAVCVSAVSLIRNVTFQKESVITEQKNILGKIRFFQNYCRAIYPMFLWTFFSEKDDFVRETKIVTRKKYSESEKSSEKSNNTSIMGQPRR
jgi:hypothetical protein